MKNLENETEGIWRPYGVQLEWTDAGGSESVANGMSLEAIVEHQIEEPELKNRRSVLGRAFVRLDAPAPQPILVSFDATENVLARRTNDRGSFGLVDHDRELARALGRVLAHEIGHVLLGAPYHDRDGLMRAAFRPNELAALEDAPFRLTCDGVGRLKSRVGMLTEDPGFAIDRAPCIPRHQAR